MSVNIYKELLQIYIFSVFLKVRVVLITLAIGLEVLIVS
jgi:hypothetical protein